MKNKILELIKTEYLKTQNETHELPTWACYNKRVFKEIEDIYFDKNLSIITKLENVKKLLIKSNIYTLMALEQILEESEIIIKKDED